MEHWSSFETVVPLMRTPFSLMTPCTRMSLTTPTMLCTHLHAQCTWRGNWSLEWNLFWIKLFNPSSGKFPSSIKPTSQLGSVTCFLLTHCTISTETLKNKPPCDWECLFHPNFLLWWRFSKSCLLSRDWCIPSNFWAIEIFKC